MNNLEEFKAAIINSDVDVITKFNTQQIFDWVKTGNVSYSEFDKFIGAGLIFAIGETIKEMT